MATSIVSEQKLRAIVKKVVPFPVREALRWSARVPARSKEAMELTWAKHRIDTAARNDASVKIANFDVRINRGVTPYHLYHDIFVKRVYHFEAQGPTPRILDCGSNMGMSLLYFKHVYPQARVACFEPDPSIFSYLEENVERNHLKDVELARVALGATPGMLTFNSDGEVGSHLTAYMPGGSAVQYTKYEVPCVRLLDYLNEPVDFMKMNIEGAEWEVLSDSEPKLRQIREMNIEYHRLPGVPCTLHSILDLLHRSGFMYVVSDFGLMMYGSPQPPARVDSQALYWRQIYACRLD